MVYDAPKIKTFASVFSPSGIGLVFYVFFSGLLVLFHQIPVIEQYIDVPEGFNVFRLITSWLDSFLTGVFGETSTETLVVGLFWALVGLGVYIFLRGIGRFIDEFSEGVEEREYMWPKGADRNRGVHEAARRSLFRSLAFIGLLLVVFGPLARVLGGPVWTVFLGPSQPLQLGVWFVATCFVLHIIVVLLRLIVLKPRLFD